MPVQVLSNVILLHQLEACSSLYRLKSPRDAGFTLPKSHFGKVAKPAGSQHALPRELPQYGCIQTDLGPLTVI